MNTLSKYNIVFKGLIPGMHKFNFHVENDLFNYFGKEIINDSDISAKVVLEKQDALIILTFDISGTVNIQCDRCLDYYDQPINSKNKIFVKYENKEEENKEIKDEKNEDVIIIRPEDSEINIGKLIHDFIILALPLKKMHPDDENGNSLCNPEMIRRIKKLSTAEKKTDDRWDKLKKLLNNN